MTSQERPYCAGPYALVPAADGKPPVLADTGDETVGAEVDKAKEEEKPEKAKKKTRTSPPKSAGYPNRSAKSF